MSLVEGFAIRMRAFLLHHRKQLQEHIRKKLYMLFSMDTTWFYFSGYLTPMSYQSFVVVLRALVDGRYQHPIHVFSCRMSCGFCCVLPFLSQLGPTLMHQEKDAKILERLPRFVILVCPEVVKGYTIFAIDSEYISIMEKLQKEYYSPNFDQ